MTVVLIFGALIALPFIGWGALNAIHAHYYRMAKRQGVDESYLTLVKLSEAKNPTMLRNAYYEALGSSNPFTS
ncbi:hypothetical protein [Rosenbergiella collisarenosi]|uniref:hypothetical protein n=1 Tax=Rosenbergiella collisarenosi TaxID=1544695 RepID=UPI001F4DCD3A|nr:hypothetical protein [Rosenbergiella collisarenosi]